MTEESLLIVKELSDQVRQLFGEFEFQERKIDTLRQEIRSLNEKIEALENEKAVLTKKYEHLKLAKSFESGSSDSQVAKQKINKIMREIDKCVALLNE